MKMPKEVTEAIPTELKACAANRIAHNDMRVITFVQKMRLVEELRKENKEENK